MFDNSNEYHNERIMAGVSQGLEQHRTLVEIFAKAADLGLHTALSVPVEVGRHPHAYKATGRRYTKHLIDGGIEERLAAAVWDEGEVTVYFESSHMIGNCISGWSPAGFFSIDKTGICSWSSRPGDEWLGKIIN